MLKNTKAALVFLFIFFIFSFLGSAKESAVSEAVSYLALQPSSAGNALALISAGESVDLSFLKNFSSDNAIGYAKPILALSAGGKDARTYPDEDFVLKLKSFYDGDQVGDPGLVNDTVWSLIALRSVGVSQSDPLIQSSKQFILDSRNDDGGWSWNVGGESSTDDTAAAVISLVEAGVSVSDIEESLSFIGRNQNSDGGFSFYPGEYSNTSSSSWVLAMINKIGDDGSWTKEGKSPKDFILSMQDDDGGFWWVEPGLSEWNNKAPTADALIAISGNTFPVRSLPEGSKAYLRIEGSEDTLCRTEIVARTAMDAVIVGAQKCSYSYHTQETSFGAYISRIGNDSAEGSLGWMYFVDWDSPAVGAADYVLSEGDELLWYYGEWGWSPLRITVDKEVYLVGEEVSGFVNSVNAGLWETVSGAEVGFMGESVTSAEDGSFSFTVSNEGVLEISASKEGYVRSDVVSVVAGETVREIDLSVEIIGEEESYDDDLPDLGFTISQGSLSFGALYPGQEKEMVVEIRNTGKNNVAVQAEVKGDAVFRSINLNGKLWSLFRSVIPFGLEQDISVSLRVVEEAKDYGNKKGSLIFWGTSDE